MSDQHDQLQHPTDSLEQLRVLGIPLQYIEDSLLDGYHGRASCSALHPRWFAGSHQYADIVQGLRLRLLQDRKKWTASEERGLATVVSPDGAFQIAVSSGDENVGKEDSPKTKNPKGSATAHAIEQNEEQLSLFRLPLPVSLSPKRKNPPTGMTTWFLLYHQTAKEIWYEFSLPKSVDSDGRPNAWAKRYKFAPIKLEATPKSEQKSTPTQHVVDVTRR